MEWEPPQGWEAWTRQLDLLQWVPRPVFARPDCLGSLGRDSYFIEPYNIHCPDRVHIGDNVVVGERSFLSVVQSCKDVKHEPELRIGNDVLIGGNVVIECTGDVEIGDRTGFSVRVVVGGASRGYEDSYAAPTDMVGDDALPVRIGSEVVIGIGATILAGVTIGDGAFIGAGTVVTRDVPSRSVVFGNPGMVIRSWDERTGRWRIGG
jgi:acetyltransferase-like isoleucine patch superfamily enzyme